MTFRLKPTTGTLGTQTDRHPWRSVREPSECEVSRLTRVYRVAFSAKNCSTATLGTQPKVVQSMAIRAEYLKVAWKIVAPVVIFVMNV